VNRVTATGKTVEDAVRAGLQQLKATREQVTYRVLEEPSRGFLGFIGTREAKVEVVLQEQNEEVLVSASEVSSSEPPVDEILTEVILPSEEEDKPEAKRQTEQEAVKQGKSFLEEVLSTMGLNAEVEETKFSGNPGFIIKGKGLGLIIGRRGQTLDSLQYLVNIVANRYAEKRVRIVLDAENYRQKRKESLEQLAERMAAQAVRTNKPVRLEPMNPAERKIIHSYLQKRSKVETMSEGSEPYRRVVISPKK
jgi:spoIIIJ-associated protein